MPLRSWLARTLGGALIILAAIVSVGLTAPADGPFAIGIRPVFFRLDPQSIAEERAHALGVDVDIKFGALHLHFKWAAIPLTPSTTQSPATLL